MLIALAIVLSVGFVGWLIWRAVKKKPIKLHMVMYGLSALAGIFSLAFFMTMDIPTIAKVLSAITLGGVLIYLASRRQQRKQRG